MFIWPPSVCRSLVLGVRGPLALSSTADIDLASFSAIGFAMAMSACGAFATSGFAGRARSLIFFSIFLQLH